MSAEVEAVDHLGKRLIMRANEKDWVLRIRWGISESLPEGKGEMVWDSESLDKAIEAIIRDALHFMP